MQGEWRVLKKKILNHCLPDCYEGSTIIWESRSEVTGRELLSFESSIIKRKKEKKNKEKKY